MIATIKARQESAPPELVRLVHEFSTIEFPELATRLKTFCAHWDRPRTDLYVWVPLLNRFDQELASIVDKYDLASENAAPVVLDPEQELIVISIFDFSKVLLHHGSNRGIYPSTGKVLALLKTVNTKVAVSALSLLLKISLRYSHVDRASRPPSLQELRPETLARFATIVPQRAGGHRLELYEFANPAFALPDSMAAIEFDCPVADGSICTVKVTKEQVASLSLEQIMQQAQSSVPKEFLMDFLSKARLAKAASGCEELRKDLVVIQCNAVGAATLLLYSRDFRTHILVKAPNTFKLVANLVASETPKTSNTTEPARTEIPMDLQILGLDVLFNVCHDYRDSHDIRKTLLSRMGQLGFLSILPQITQSARRGEPINEEYTVLMFLVLVHIFGTSSISSGFVPLILDFIQTTSGPKYLHVQCEAMVLLDALVIDSTSAMPAFLSHSGVKILVDLLARETSPEVLAAQKEHPPNYTKVDYALSYYRVQWIKSFLVMISNVLKHKRTPVLINQLMNSPILSVCTSIVARHHIFGWRIVSLALQTIAVMQEYENSTIATLAENNMLDQILTEVKVLLSKSHYYLAPTVQIIAALGTNEQGAEFIKTYSLLDVFFDALGNADLTDYGALYSVGQIFETLLSDQPEFHSIIVERLIDFTGKIIQRLDKLDNDASTSPKNAASINSFAIETEGSDISEPSRPAAIVQNVLILLNLVLSNHVVMIEFTKLKGLDKLIDLVTHRSLPYDFILTKDRIRPNGAFGSILRALFGLEYDTDYVLGTWFNRMAQVSTKTANLLATTSLSAEEFSLAEAVVEDMGIDYIKEFLHNISTLSALLVGLRHMVFSDVGTGYRPILALHKFAEPQFERILTDFTSIFITCIWQYARFFNDVPTNIVVASWPLHAHQWNSAYPMKPINKDQRQLVKEKETDAVNGDVVKYKHQKAARLTVTSFHLLLKWLFSVLANYSTTDMAMAPRNKRSMLKVADSVASCIVSLLRSNLFDDMSIASSVKRFALMNIAATTLKTLSGRTACLNFASVVMFKQRGGIMELIRCIQKATESPDSKPLPFELKMPESNMMVESQSVLLDVLKLVSNRTDILSRTIQFSALVAQGKAKDQPDSFDLTQYLVETRITTLYGLLKLFESSTISKLEPRVTEFVTNILGSIYTEAPEDLSTPRDDDKPMEYLPQKISWENMPDPEELVQILVKLGVSASEAQSELDSTNNDIVQAFENLKAGKYKDIARSDEISVRTASVGTDFVTLYGKKLVTVTDLALLRQRFLEELAPNISKLINTQPHHVFFAVNICCKVFEPGLLSRVRNEPTSTSDAPLSTVAPTAVKQVKALFDIGSSDLKNPSALHFLALFLGELPVMETVATEVSALAPNLIAMVCEPGVFQEPWFPYALTIVELILSRFDAKDTPFGRLALFDSEPLNHMLDPALFLNRMGADVVVKDYELATVAVARLAVYLASKSTANAALCVSSGVVLKLLEAVKVEAGNAFGKRLELCVSSLIRLNVESDERLLNIMERTIITWVSEKRSSFTVNVIARELAHMISRDPVLFIEAIDRICCLPYSEFAEVEVVELVIKYRDQLVEEANGLIEHAKQNKDKVIEPVPKVTEKPLFSTSDHRPRPLIDDVGKGICLHILQELMNSGYVQSSEAARDALEAEFRCKQALNGKTSSHPQYAELYQAHAAAAQRYNDAWTAFRITSNYTAYLLTTIQELVRISDPIKYEFLSYGTSSQSDIGLPRGKSPFLLYALNELCVYHESPTDAEDDIQMVCQKVTDIAQETIISIINLAEDTGYTASSLHQYVARCKYVIDSIARSLTHVFSGQAKNVPPSTVWKYNFLHKMVDLTNNISQKADTAWAFYTDRPILPRLILDRKLIPLINACIAKTDMNHPQVVKMRHCVLVLFRRIADYDTKNFDRKDDSNSEEEDYFFDSDVFGFTDTDEVDEDDEDMDEISDYDYELEHPQENNLFRNSALGMLEESEGELIEQHEEPIEMDYDHVTDDEILSDIQEDDEHEDLIHGHDDEEITGSDIEEGEEDDIEDDDGDDEDEDNGDIEITGLESGHTSDNAGLSNDDEESGDGSLEYSDDESRYGASDIEIANYGGESNSQYSDVVADMRNVVLVPPDQNGQLVPFLDFTAPPHASSNPPSRELSMRRNFTMTWLISPILVPPSQLAHEITHYGGALNDTQKGFTFPLTRIPNSGASRNSDVNCFIFKNVTFTRKHFEQLSSMFHFYNTNSDKLMTSVVNMLNGVLGRDEMKTWANEIETLYKYIEANGWYEHEDVGSQSVSGSDEWESVDEEDDEEEGEEQPEYGDDIDEFTGFEDRDTDVVEHQHAFEISEDAVQSDEVDGEAEEGNDTVMTDVPTEPIMVNFGGTEVDISGTGIDPQFLAELPDDLLQEVLENHLRSLQHGDGPEEEDDQEEEPEYVQAEFVMPEGANVSFMDIFSNVNRALLENPSALSDDSPRGIHELHHLLRQAAGDQRTASHPLTSTSTRGTQPDNPTDRHIADGIRSIARKATSVFSNDRKDDTAWSTAPSRVHTGIEEWTPIFDKASIASLMRHLYQPFVNIDDTMMYSVLERLSENQKMKEPILLALLHVIHDASIDESTLQNGYGTLTSKALSSDLLGAKSKAQISDIPPHFFKSTTPPNLVIRQALALLSAWVRGIPDSNVLFLEPTKRLKGRKPSYLINMLLALLDRPMVAENSYVLARVMKILLQVTAPPPSEDPVTSEEDAGTGEDTAVATGTSENVLENSTLDTHDGDTEGSDVDDNGNLTLDRVPARAETSSSRMEDVGYPKIPMSNLERLISVLTVRDCDALSFNRTLGTVYNLGTIPGIFEWTRKKLLKDAHKVSQQITGELKNLSLPDGEINESALSKFTVSNSSQTQLLRLLTATDYLFDPKRSRSSGDLQAKTNELMEIYKTLDPHPLWHELGLCLSLNGDGSFHVATALLPLIECFTVIAKRVMALEKTSPYAGTLRDTLIDFTMTHKKVLNHLVRNNPKLLSGSFAVLAKDPRILEFDNKQNYFNRKTKEEKSQLGPTYMRLQVRRDQVFLDTYRALFFKDATEIKRADIEIVFQGEEGIDAGGVTREWYATLSRQIFNPDYALFTPVSAHSTTFHPNRTSWVNPEHLSFFKFVGRIIGKAVYDGKIMECYFSRAVYKYLLRKEVTLQDMEAVDEDYYKSLVWMLENDITDVITETFSVDVDEYGVNKVIELKPDGANIDVTEENKREYVQLIVEYTLVKSVKAQLDQLTLGFSEIIPHKLMSLFDERELELLISGLPDIDVDDWRNNTTYQNYTVNSPQIKWFWRTVTSFDQEERAKLLQFATGTSKVPLSGFAELESSRGSGKFAILRDFGDKTRWPSAHTCTNQINLPAYESYEELRSALLKAITEGNTGFGFA